MKPLLSVRRLKTYFFLDEGTVKAVDGVDFDVHPGQIVGIVGESGCGKSVTIKSVMQLIQEPGRIVDGEVLFQHRNDDGSEQVVDLAKLAPHSKAMRTIRGADIALIPQEPMASFSPVHTIGDQIMETVLLHQDVNKQEARRIAIDRLQEVGMPNPERRMDAYSWELSGGLRQRAMIAMSLACNPRLLIADEPTTAIDVTTQAQVLRLILDLQEHHNMAVIFITHDLGVIAQIADFVVVMYLGRVMETGPVDDIFFHPQHPYTKALLESIPSIYAPAGERLPTIEGSLPHPFSRPSGCPFYPRCISFMPGVCNTAAPELKPVNKRQTVSCFLSE